MTRNKNPFEIAVDLKITKLQFQEEKMKKLLVLLTSLILGASMVFAAPPQNPCNPCNKKTEQASAKKTEKSKEKKGKLHNPFHKKNKKDKSAQNPCNPCKKQ